MSAFGRFLHFKSNVLSLVERPLSVKADIRCTKQISAQIADFLRLQ
jgi:hypothetical protein